MVAPKIEQELIYHQQRLFQVGSATAMLFCLGIKLVDYLLLAKLLKNIKKLKI
jgi:hypothetical protein